MKAMKLIPGTMTVLVLFSMIFLLPWKLSAQDSTKKEVTKKIYLKVVSDDNGTTQTIDTTITMSDSTMLDSIRSEVDRVIRLTRDGRHGRLRMHAGPGAWDYNFDFRDIPDCTRLLEEIGDLDIEIPDPPPCPQFGWRDDSPRPGGRMFRFRGGQGGGLNDLIGDIPMDRVKSYSIKNTRNGKRIVIDVEDGPGFDRRDRVVVIREKGRPGKVKKYPMRKSKVFIEMDDDAGSGGSKKGAGVPPPPPPPPPPDDTK